MVVTIQLNSTGMPLEGCGDPLNNNGESLDSRINPLDGNGDKYMLVKNP